jgi:DNA polymerase
MSAPLQMDADQKHTLHRDYETRGVLRLASVGVHQYASDAGTSVLCAAYAVGDNPVRLWTPGDPIPHEFVEAAHNPAWLVCAHNDGFETAVEQHILGPGFGWPQIPIERHRCTMAMALAAGLPARLGALADALELANRKDAGGERLMHQMSKPRRPHKDENPAGTYWFEDQERVERLHAYCVQDMEVERELYRRLPPLSPSEQVLWTLNYTINTRGFHVDRAFAAAARAVAEAAVPEIDAEITTITSGAVTATSQVARLMTRKPSWALDLPIAANAWTGVRYTKGG